jgi:hypothetical protein
MDFLNSELEMLSLVKEIRRQVEEKLGKPIVLKILRSLQFKFKVLWGTEKHYSFNNTIIIFTLYKDLYGISYSKLTEMFRTFIKVAKETIQHNVKAIRIALKKWAMGIIVVEDANRLRRLATKLEKPFPCQEVALWIDSSDFRIKGKRRRNG